MKNGSFCETLSRRIGSFLCQRKQALAGRKCVDVLMALR
jgi:hypothetical protein